MAFPDDLEWNQPGVEPTQAKKDEGWKPEEKPPAEYFNWFFNRTSQAVKYLKGESDKLIDDAKIGNRTITDTVTAAAGAGTITNLLSKLGNMIKQITGKSAWYTAPATTLQALSDLIVSTAGANKLLKLDANSKLPADVTGNAATATKLQTARTIAGVPFDGSANINLTPANIGAAPDGYGLGTFSKITGDIDVNTLSTVGFYLTGAGSANVPFTGVSGFLEVFGSNTSATGVVQRIVNSSTGLAYQRMKNTGTWGAWKQIATTDNYYDKATSDSNYLPRGTTIATGD